MKIYWISLKSPKKRNKNGWRVWTRRDPEYQARTPLTWNKNRNPFASKGQNFQPRNLPNSLTKIPLRRIIKKLAKKIRKNKGKLEPLNIKKKPKPPFMQKWPPNRINYCSPFKALDISKHIRLQSIHLNSILLNSLQKHGPLTTNSKRFKSLVTKWKSGVNINNCPNYLRSLLLLLTPRN